MLASSILAALVMYLSYLNFPEGYGRMESGEAKSICLEEYPGDMRQKTLTKERKMIMIKQEKGSEKEEYISKP